MTSRGKLIEVHEQGQCAVNQDAIILWGWRNEKKLDYGMVYMDDSQVHDEWNATFGGVKISGMGRERR